MTDLIAKSYQNVKRGNKTMMLEESVQTLVEGTGIGDLVKFKKPVNGHKYGEVHGFKLSKKDGKIHPNGMVSGSVTHLSVKPRKDPYSSVNWNERVDVPLENCVKVDRIQEIENHKHHQKMMKAAGIKEAVEHSGPKMTTHSSPSGKKLFVQADSKQPGTHHIYTKKRGDIDYHHVYTIYHNGKSDAGNAAGNPTSDKFYSSLIKQHKEMIKEDRDTYLDHAYANSGNSTPDAPKARFSLKDKKSGKVVGKFTSAGAAHAQRTKLGGNANTHSIMSEEMQRLEELSKTTMANYIKKANQVRDDGTIKGDRRGTAVMKTIDKVAGYKAGPIKGNAVTAKWSADKNLSSKDKDKESFERSLNRLVKEDAPLVSKMAVGTGSGKVQTSAPKAKGSAVNAFLKSKSAGASKNKTSVTKVDLDDISGEA